MKKITVERLTEEQKKSLNIPEKPVAHGPWSVWECGPSAFDWHYDDIEQAYIYRGKVKVLTKSGAVELRSGDFVTFPKGLSCRWEIFEGVRKVYRFV